MDKIMFEALTNHLKDIQKKLHLQKVKLKVLTKQQRDLQTRLSQLQAMYNQEFSQIESLQFPNLSLNSLLNPAHSQKSVQSAAQAVHSVQHQQILIQIKKLQTKIKNKEAKLKPSLTSSIKQDDEILVGLHTKLENQEKELLASIDRKIDIGIKTCLNNQLKKRIKIHQELIFKAKQNPIMQKRVIETNNKDIVRSGYTDRMLALLPKNS